MTGACAAVFTELCRRSGCMESVLLLLFLLPPLPPLPSARAAPGGCFGPDPSACHPCSSGRTPLPDLLLPRPEPWPSHGRDPLLAFPGPGQDSELTSLGGSRQSAWGALGGRSELPGSQFPGGIVPYWVTAPIVRFPCVDDAPSSCPGRVARPGGAILSAGAGPLQLRDLRQRDLPAAVPGVG